MSTFFDALETREPAQREAELMAALPLQLAHARRAAPAFAESLQGVDVERVVDRAALAHLPVVRKHELQERQVAARAASGGNVFGGFRRWAGVPCRVFSSPGSPTSPKALRAIIGVWLAHFCGGFSLG
jgi:phenylacetate-CoA ligase